MDFMGKDSWVVNIISGPGAGKTTMASLVFAKLKIKGETAELVPEYAKNLVWTGDFETLNNQHFVSKKQYEMFQSVAGNVKFIVTDGSILHGLYYNISNPENMSNVAKTEKCIMDWYSRFNNINIFLERGNFPYERAGRLQDEDGARKIDEGIRAILDKKGIEYRSFVSAEDNVPEMLRYILTRDNNKS